MENRGCAPGALFIFMVNGDLGLLRRILGRGGGFRLSLHTTPGSFGTDRAAVLAEKLMARGK